jgi:hypothetical protein
VLHTATTRGRLGNSLVFRCQLDQHTLRTLVGRDAGACKRAADPAPDTPLSGMAHAHTLDDLTNRQVAPRRVRF